MYNTHICTCVICVHTYINTCTNIHIKIIQKFLKPKDLQMLKFKTVKYIIKKLGEISINS